MFTLVLFGIIKLKRNSYFEKKNSNEIVIIIIISNLVKHFVLRLNRLLKIEFLNNLIYIQTKFADTYQFEY